MGKKTEILSSALEVFVRALKTHREVLLYLVFGGLTTLVNVVTFGVMTDGLGIHYTISNAVAWIASVAFAYVTNRKWVFESRSSHILREMCLFVGCRVFSGLCDMGVLVLCVEVLSMSTMLAKLLTQVIVVVLNYVFSKLIVFRRKP